MPQLKNKSVVTFVVHGCCALLALLRLARAVLNYLHFFSLLFAGLLQKTHMELKETTALEIISLFDRCFQLITQRSMPGEVVASSDNIQILEMNRTTLRDFINGLLTDAGFKPVSQNSAAWRSLLNERIQDSGSLEVNLALGDGRHSTASSRISGKSQRLTLMFNPEGLRIA